MKNKSLLPALGVIGEALEVDDPVPFGLSEAEFLEYAANHFEKRIEHLKKARGVSPDQVYRVAQQTSGSWDCCNPA